MPRVIESGVFFWKEFVWICLYFNSIHTVLIIMSSSYSWFRRSSSEGCVSLLVTATADADSYRGWWTYQTLDSRPEMTWWWSSAILSDVKIRARQVETTGLLTRCSDSDLALVTSPPPPELTSAVTPRLCDTWEMMEIQPSCLSAWQVEGKPVSATCLPDVATPRSRLVVNPWTYTHDRRTV